MLSCAVTNAFASQPGERNNRSSTSDSDRDPLYRYHQWQRNLRILGVSEIKTVPYVPLSHPFIERLVGTIRRECLDQSLFWTATDLELKLLAFKNYYNGCRVHAALEGKTPIETTESKGADFNQLDQDLILAAISSQISTPGSYSVQVGPHDVKTARPKVSVIKLTKVFTMSCALVVKTLCRLNDRKLVETLLPSRSRGFESRAPLLSFSR